MLASTSPKPGPALQGCNRCASTGPPNPKAPKFFTWAYYIKKKKKSPKSYSTNTQFLVFSPLGADGTDRRVFSGDAQTLSLPLSSSLVGGRSSPPSVLRSSAQPQRPLSDSPTSSLFVFLGSPLSKAPIFFLWPLIPLLTDLWFLSNSSTSGFPSSLLCRFSNWICSLSNSYKFSGAKAVEDKYNDEATENQANEALVCCCCSVTLPFR